MENKNLLKNTSKEHFIQPEFDKEMMWGHYKPHLIYSLSQRDIISNNPITFSLMYYDPDNLIKNSDLKYKVEDTANDDVLINYEVNNGKSFSLHRIFDKTLDINLLTSFIKVGIGEFYLIIENSEIKIKTENKKIGVVLNSALQVFDKNLNDNRTLSLSFDEKGWIIKIIANKFLNYHDEYLKIYLFLNETLISPKDNKYLDFCFNSFNYPKELNWLIKDLIFTDLVKSKKSEYFFSFFKNPDKKRFYHRNIRNKLSDNDSTLTYLNFCFNKCDNFKLIIHFNTNALPSEVITPLDISSLKFNYISEFNTKFKKKFIFYKSIPSIQLECAKQSLTNLLGGLCYSYGNLDCNQKEDNSNDYFKSMLSHTPSRLGFPRPFLWDEGFHTLITSYWSPETSLQIISDWLSTVSENGWIPREQPRGPELKSYIPGLKQDNREANPPTLMFTLLKIRKSSLKLFKKFIKFNWEKLKKWYNWWYNWQGIFDNQQNHQNLFKWWGSDYFYNFGSGMDDFPRNQNGFKPWANIDATVWGYFFTHAMLKIAKSQEIDENYVNTLKTRKDTILTNLNNHLLDSRDHLYKDRFASILDDSLSFSTHLGYPTLMPLIFGIIPDNSKELDCILDFLSNINTIWTEYGIASLSKDDFYYGTGINYWRGPIWVNINYLVLRALKLFYENNTKVYEIYVRLRNNIINTICGNWQRFGYFFEHYNQNLDGIGSGFRQFNGWTSLITLIIYEYY